MDDQLSEKLSRAQSNLSFHAIVNNTNLLNETQEQIPYASKLPPQALGAIYVLCQLLQLMIAYSLIQNIDAITIATQRCIVNVIITLMYIQFFDKRLFQLDQSCIRVIGAMAGCQVIASLIGFWAMYDASQFRFHFPFSEICAFHQLTPGYIQVFNHLLYSAGNQINLLISLVQTISTLLFGQNLLFVLVCLLQPACLAFSHVIKFLMNKQLPFFTLMLYQSLFGLPVYILLNLMTQEVQNIFSGAYFLQFLVWFIFREITFMTILQMIAYIAQNEIQAQKSIEMWVLPGAVTLLSIFVQVGYYQIDLNFGTLSIIFIVFTSISKER
ncbi:unnamed protein product (macronuclear) [Paramecium tetraurelia]|uniref:EamA domain-containing protein n=1 Tax=Paramecium tetraurelia TaxID=5888 RepID=A0BUZ2_PARTE|nr:uncharacterized protein GSPATT00005605001 [Paramecium tetraurelia]CAK62359.1 unnamed protein product [Paramecium tetraurelia]|eukprot:XP_001429757.1 hypothetical protein (macronuclear) [Paramecium tetraurelia strain d4-2]